MKRLGRFLLITAVIATLYACATTGEIEKVTSQNMNDSVQFQRYVNGDFIQQCCIEYIENLEEHDHILKMDTYEIEVIGVALVSTVTMSTENLHPLKGTWKESFTVNCGTESYRVNLLFDAKRRNAPECSVMVMGDSRTDHKLQQDLIVPVVISAGMLREEARGTELSESLSHWFIADTELLDFETIYDPWKERWLVQFDQNEPLIPMIIELTPKTSGGTGYKVYPEGDEGKELQVIYY